MCWIEQMIHCRICSFFKKYGNSFCHLKLEYGWWKWVMNTGNSVEEVLTFLPKARFISFPMLRVHFSYKIFRVNNQLKMHSTLNQKWNESGFRPPLCIYRLNWARRTSWGWWDDWDDTVLQTQDSKYEPWRSEAEHATSRSRRLPTILTFTRGWGRNILFLSNRRDREPNPELWRERQRC